MPVFQEVLFGPPYGLKYGNQLRLVNKALQCNLLGTVLYPQGLEVDPFLIGSCLLLFVRLVHLVLLAHVMLLLAFGMLEEFGHSHQLVAQVSEDVQELQSGLVRLFMLLLAVTGLESSLVLEHCEYHILERYLALCTLEVVFLLVPEEKLMSGCF